MKKNYMNIRTAAMALALSASLFAVSAPVFASKKHEAVKSSVAVQPEVAVTGNDANSSTFLVTFNPGTRVKFLLSVSDVDGDVLYRKNFDTDKFSTYIRLLTQADESQNFHFTIKILPAGEVHTFDVKSNVKLVKSVVVEKQ